MIAIVSIVVLAALLAYREYVHAQERKDAIAERAELPNHRAGPGTANTVTNVVDENGDPVTITYHDRPIG